MYKKMSCLKYLFMFCRFQPQYTILDSFDCGRTEKGVCVYASTITERFQHQN